MRGLLLCGTATTAPATGTSAAAASPALLGALAAEATARAVLSAPRHAQARPGGLPALRDLADPL